VRGVRFDLEAVFWSAVAFAASVLGIFFVLIVWRFAGGSSEGVGYVVVSGVWNALCAGIAVALLVCERPSRGLGAMLGAMWSVVAVLGVAVAVVRLIAAPTGWEGYAAATVYGLSFGMIDIETFRPLAILPPKDWYVIGVLAGYGAGRLIAGRRVPEDERDTSWWLARVTKE